MPLANITFIEKYNFQVFLYETFSVAKFKGFN